MNYQNDPKLYDHVFYQSKLPLLLIAFLFGVMVAISGCDLLFTLYKTGTYDLKMLAVFIGSLIFVVAGILAFFLVRKRFSLGINHDGLYVRYYGFVPWSQIKEFQFGWLGKFLSKKKCIFILLNDPESFFAKQSSIWWRINKHVVRKKVVIMANTVPVNLQKLLGVLHAYHHSILQNR